MKVPETFLHFDSEEIDSFFGQPFVDIYEWRDAPTSHRYVHGGFGGTDTRFSFYFPPDERYGGRFLHHIEGGNGGHETTATGPLGSLGGIAFAASCGAYLVESNQGHFADDLSILRTEPTIHAYRASVHSARYSKHLAGKIYGHPPGHGYVFGGSGGSPRTLLCLERAPDVFDGAVPFIMGHRTSWSLGFSLQAQAMRLLGSDLIAVIDAMEPGGSGNPFDGLTGEHREILVALYRAGLPRHAEASLLTSGYLGTFASHISALVEFDPEYFEDFWSIPGYAGADGELADDVIAQRSIVKDVVTAGELRARLDAGAGVRNTALVWHARGDADTPVGLVLDGVDTSRLHGASLALLNGAAAGHELYCVGVHGDVVIGGADTPFRFEGVAPGDDIAVDNRKYLAYCLLHRYQVDPSAPEYEQFQLDGRPVYPQRPRRFADSGMLSGDTPSGDFAGKVIVVQNAHDAACWPNAALSFARLVKSEHHQRFDDEFRLWFLENAAHIPASLQPADRLPAPRNRLIDYEGFLEQALRYLIDWVEQGSVPPSSSGYEIDANQWFRLATSALTRKGIQPVVSLSTTGKDRAEVAAGEAVSFAATAEAAPGVGDIVAIEWDFEGRGLWDETEDAFDPSPSMSLTRAHAYTEPGTYFAAIRVAATVDGDGDNPFGRLSNLARVRVVVR